MQVLATLDGIYKRYGYALAMGAAFLLPLKLSLTYILLVPLILLWLVHSRSRLRSVLAPAPQCTVPLALFIAVAAMSAAASIDPWRAFRRLDGLVFFGLSILVYRDLSLSSGFQKILLALVSGQTLAALHSVFEGAFDQYVSRFFLGAVTESGQLALSILVAAGMLVHLARSRDTAQSDEREDTLLGVTNFCVFSMWGFSPLSKTPPLTFWTICLLSLILLAYSAFRCRGLFRRGALDQTLVLRALRTIVMPLLLTALLVNLKRGPWMGIAVGGALFVLLELRRLFIPMLIVAAVLFCTVRPIQDRVAKSEEHFFIVGGRSEIWNIGMDLATRYPLGVGYRNSGFLRKFSDDIPEDLNHFHNNFLNVLVETGWLGLAFFLWWIISLLREAFSVREPAPERIMARAIGCGILSWQTAGIVEYNFGDSEVVLIVFVVVGVLASIRARDVRSSASTA